MKEFLHCRNFCVAKLTHHLKTFHYGHERDLSNSANERFTLPMASILLDEMIETMIRIISNLKINDERVQENLYITKGQIFAEFVLEALIKKGIPRFIAYRDVQRVAFEAHDKKMNYMDALIKR